MRTERLFDKDSYINKFEATVLSCTEREDGNFAVLLDVTAFFPNEGGQACDTGVINCARVLSVDECEGEIIHTLNRAVGIGERVLCEIDFAERFRKMQNHTAEHIVSGVIHRLFGYDNVGFHLGDDYMTADFSGELSDADIERAETEANKAIFGCHPVRAYYPGAEELASLEYRSKLDVIDDVRIVEIEDVDMCACCAPHVGNTGEIGLVKIVDAVKYKGGMRLTMLAGFDVLSDYRARQEQIRRVSTAISAKQSEIAQGVDRMLEEMSALKGRLSALKKENMQLKLGLLKETDDSIIIFEDDGDMLALRNFVNEAVKKTRKICACFSGNDKAGYKYIIASETVALREMAKEISEKLGGKGGGSEVMIQGSVTATRQSIEEYFKF